VNILRIFLRGESREYVKEATPASPPALELFTCMISGRILKNKESISKKARNL